MASLRPPSRSYSTPRPPTAQSRTGDPSSDARDSIVAILQSRQGAEVAAVALDQDYGRLTITQFGDSSTFVKTLTFLHANPPLVVLVPPTARPTQPTSYVSSGGNASSGATLLARCIQDEFPRTAIVPVARKYWDEQFLIQLSAKDHERLNTIESTKSKYYALSCVCALFKYLDTQGTSFSPNSLKVRYAPFEGTCLIDSESAKNLELVQNILDQKSKQHLLGMLNRCYTPSGTRMLRSNILAPSTDREQIMGRYEAVEELVNSEERLRSLRKALETLKSIDLEKLTSKILASTSATKLSATPRASKSLLPKASPDPSNLINQKLSHLLNLRTFLLSLSSLRTSLEKTRSSLLVQSLRVFEDQELDRMREIVEENVNKDLWAVREPMGQRRGRGGGAEEGEGGIGETRKLTKSSRLFAIRSEKKRFLDVARETYRENINDVHELRDALKARVGFEISLVNTDKGDFLLECSKEDWAEHGREARELINVNDKGKTVRFSSLELQKRNARISESILEVLLLSDEILDEIFEDILRPELTETLAIKSGRNPLHEQFRISDGAFVPNDTYASLASSFQIITGSNMSGKSTLLRQIALLHVMAQIGCFVPASYASFRPVSALLTRLSNDDNIAASLSTFAQEMTTMSMILGALAVSDSSRPCLVIVDELGRGTSPEEGIGIAHAIAEEILNSGAVCFFATHFKELPTTLSRYPNVVSLQLETEIDRSQADYSLTFHHRLIDGATPLVHYGLELAKIAKLPTPVIDKAHLVAATLDALAQMKKSTSIVFQQQRRKQSLLALKASLKELAQSRQVDGSTILTILRDLQQETISILEETSITEQEGADESRGIVSAPTYEEDSIKEEEEELPAQKSRLELESSDRGVEREDEDEDMLSLRESSGETPVNDEERAESRDEEMLDVD
ncbi:hypothetical protein JCM16303_003899 [Sporobolomyces ruberrimus]